MGGWGEGGNYTQSTIIFLDVLVCIRVVFSSFKIIPSLKRDTLYIQFK